jgi:hypothetical protein
VLACEVEDVNSKTNIFKDRVVLDHLAKGAIVIEEDMVWHEVIDTIGANNHFLHDILSEHHLRYLKHGILTITLETASAPKNVSLAMISPHGVTNICLL